MAPTKTTWLVWRAGLRRTWEKRPATQLTRDVKKAYSAMKLLPTIRSKISIAVQSGRSLSHAESILFVARSNTKLPLECVPLVHCALNALARTMGAQCKGTKTKRH